MVYGELFTFNSSAAPVSDILNESIWIDPDSCNHAQLALVTIIYGVVLYQSSNLIANGSEFLLLVPSLAGLVGSIVLPILGAVPDGMMTLCSGLGPRDIAQGTVGAGVGVLAGSTVMLLTFPWFIAVTYGRVPIEKGVANFSSKSGKTGLFDSGISYEGAIKKNSFLMLLTTLIYLVIQIPALSQDNADTDTHAQADAENQWALIGGIVSLVAFCAYLYVCFLDSKQDVVLDSVIAGIQNRTISIGGALEYLVESKKGSEKDDKLMEDSKLKTILKPFFAKYDADNTGDIEEIEFHNMMRELDPELKGEETKALWKSFDASGDGKVLFGEFCKGFAKYLENAENCTKLKRSKTSSKIPNYEMADDEDGEEEVPEDLADLSYEDQQSAIKLRAAWMMALGTFTVVVVSDPFVDVLTNWGSRLGINPFYISFVVAPFASNASELLSAYTYAKKKTKKAITTSLSTLIGAACMNNTFCLGIFFGLIYFQGLAWQFTAETTAIIVIQWIIGLLAIAKDTQTWFVGVIILMMYPFCLFLVWYLENIMGWD